MISLISHGRKQIIMTDQTEVTRSVNGEGENYTVTVAHTNQTYDTVTRSRKNTDGEYWAGVIWKNIDLHLDEKSKDHDLAWLAENSGFASKVIYYNRHKLTDFSMSSLLRVANTLGVNVSDLLVAPAAAYTSSKYLVETEEHLGKLDKDNYLYIISTLLPKLSSTRQKTILQTILSFYDTSLEEIRGSV